MQSPPCCEFITEEGLPLTTLSYRYQYLRSTGARVCYDLLSLGNTQLTCGAGRSSSHFESATISRYRDAEAGLEIHLERLSSYPTRPTGVRSA